MEEKRKIKEEGKIILLDTDIFIDFFRGIKNAEELISKNINKIIFSAITESELLAGNICKNKNEEERVLHFLSQFEKIPVDNPLVQVAAKYKRNYSIALPDAIIAASAFSNDAILVTRNIKDFKMINEIITDKPY